MSVSRRNLSLAGQYSIDCVSRDGNTFSIQISDLKNSGLIADLPLDPMDNTLAAVLDGSVVERLGKDAPAVMETISGVLQAQVGAKEFIVIPAGTDLPGYVPAQEAEFKRLRQASGADLKESTRRILDEHKELVAELDSNHEFVVGMTDITKHLRHENPYGEIHAFLEGHADFTPGKMNEYKNEEIQGKKARFNNGHVTPIGLLDSRARLCGVIRCLSMGKQFGYLSDETMNQELIPLEKFPGSTEEEQRTHRGRFLLAYLMNRAIVLAGGHEHFILIAASGREEIYDAIGFQSFPIKDHDHVVTMKLGKPGPLLTSIKEKILNPFSNAEAIGRLGITPAATERPAEKVETSHQSSLVFNSSQ